MHLGKRRVAVLRLGAAVMPLPTALPSQMSRHQGLVALVSSGLHLVMHTRLFHSASPAPAAPLPPTGAQDLQRVLAALVASGLVSAHPASRRRGTTMLVHVLEPEALIAAVRSDERLLAALSEHLPLGATVEGASTLARVEEVLRSAQLRSAMGALSAALEGAENEAAILASFGLRPSDGDAALAATGDHLAALVAALNAAVARRRATNAAAGGSAPPGPLPPPGGHDEGAQ